MRSTLLYQVFIQHLMDFLICIFAFSSLLFAGDFFNDLEKEWGEYSKRKGGDAAGPKSLWEELADIGEELVEFLEKVRMHINIYP